jgi:hypothetical protein
MATLLDAWNAGTRFASQALNMLSEEKKYVQDVDLFNASMDFENRQIQIAKARETIYDDGGINYQNNPNYPKDFKEYLAKELSGWRETWGKKYADSRYFTDNLHEIESRGGTALNQALAEAEVNYARQRVNVTYEDELNTIDNNPNLGIEEKRALMLELTERTRGAAGWDEAVYERNKKAVLAKSLQAELDFTAGEGITVEAIRKRYDTLAADSLKGGNAETGEEAGLYAAVPKAKEAIAIGRDAAVASQQAYNFQQLKELDAAYDVARRDYATAVAGGDPARVDAAYREMMGAYYAGKPEQETALGKGAAEFNPDNRVQIMAMFADPPGLPKEKKQGIGIGGAETLADRRLWYIDQVASGRMTSTEAREGFREDIEAIAVGAGYQGEYAGESYMRDNYQAIKFDRLYEDMKKQFMELNPDIKTDVFDSLDRTTEEWINKAKGVEIDIRRAQARKLSDWLFDHYLDRTGTARLSNEAMRAQIERLSTEMMGQKINFMRETAAGESTYQIGGTASRDAVFARATRERQEHPEGVIELPDGTIIERGNQKSIDIYKNEAIKNLRDVLGITGMIRPSYERETTDLDPRTGRPLSYDLTSTMVFTVTGNGDKDGQYRFAADGNDRYRIEKLNGDAWGSPPGYTGNTRGEKQTEEDSRDREALRQAQERRQERSQAAMIDDTIAAIKNNPDMGARKILVNDLMLSGIPGIPEILRRAGIDPDSGGDL